MTIEIPERYTAAMRARLVQPDEPEAKPLEPQVDPAVKAMIQKGHKLRRLGKRETRINLLNTAVYRAVR